MPRVFLSYSRSDTDIMKRVYDSLTKAGVEVWTDAALKPGTKSWTNDIEDAIETSEFMVVILSENAKKSTPIENEIAYAQAQAKPIIPVLARDNESKSVPIELIRVQRIDIRTDYDRGIAQLIGALGKSAPLPEEAGESGESGTPARYDKRLAFWEGLLTRSKSKTILFEKRSPTTDYWLNTGAGKSGLAFSYLILKDGAGLDLYIDWGDRAVNKAWFDALHADADAIEQEFGAPLSWRRLDDKRASRIVYLIKGHGSLNEPESWPELQDIMIDAMIRFDRALRPRIKQLEV